MPSTAHEALVALFRDRPDLAPRLIGDALHVPLPAWSSVEVREATLTELAPAEYRADLVLLLNDEVPVFGIVLEVQLSEDGDKRYTWPVYATGLRARWRCPCGVLVVTPSSAVAAWARAALELGMPGCVFTPLVLGPEDVPWVSDEAEAVAAPGLAILSAMAHRNEPGGVATVLAATLAAKGLDAGWASIYLDLIWTGLDALARAAVEALMHTPKYEYTSEIARKYFFQGVAEGKAEARRESLIAVLEARKIVVTAAERERIELTTDLDVLGAWFARALSAQTMDEVFGPEAT